MNIRDAYAIFRNIDSDNFSDTEKGWAIRTVAEMVTHNGVTNDDMLKVIIYLWGLCFEEDETNEEI